MNDNWKDGDTRHVFLETARDKQRCHICRKPKDNIDHVSEEEYERLKKMYSEQGEGPCT